MSGIVSGWRAPSGPMVSATKTFDIADPAASVLI